jgi:transcriptional regulator with XRE-family HTH domain
MVEGNELAAFLRARREHLTPQDVGLPTSGRRRTPGLRREEVATLAGVSIDYLIRLEQGKDTHPSAAVVNALGQALRLSEPERHHFAFLAAISSSAELCPERGALPTEVRPTIRALIDGLDPTPAFVLGPIGHVLAWNEAWAALVDHTGLLDEPAPNLVSFVFRSTFATTFFAEWRTAADEQVAQLRAAQPRWGTDPVFEELVDSVSMITDFTDRWEAHSVATKRAGTKRLEHPTIGSLRVDVEVLTVADDELRVVTWHAADARTAEALASLAHQPVSPAQLRVVGSD